jgi:formamidopyrimidine-DNA glycosylase
VPELPEVEILVRHLRPALRGKTIRAIEVRRPRVLRPTSVRTFKRVLQGARFLDLTRRGKYLLFKIRLREQCKPRLLVGHLGMTGRMYLLECDKPLPRHAAVVFQLSAHQFVFEDTRYFGRLTLETAGLEALGPEPLSAGFALKPFMEALARSAQHIKVKLLDQSVVAGIGNIYASEALFRAQISPRLAARRLDQHQVKGLRGAIRETLNRAITFGSTVPLDYAGLNGRDRLFYYGASPEAAARYQERLRVYDREGLPCFRCGTPIRRIVQAARSTFFCPVCQSIGKSRGKSV